MSKVKDAKGTKIEWKTNNPTFSLDMVKIKGFGLQGGGKIDATHLQNTAYTTAWAKSLKEITDIEFEAHFDTAKLTTAPVNSLDLIRITYGSTGKYHEVWGYLDEIIPGDAVVGDKVVVSGKIVITNLNESDVETGPSYGS